MPWHREPDALSPEAALQAIALAIDDASDSGDADLISRALAWCDHLEPCLQSEGQRMLLDYFRANAWANRLAANRNNAAAVWAWDQEELQRPIYLLRRALGNPAFGELDLVRQC